jgi:hypothetical protein
LPSPAEAGRSFRATLVIIAALCVPSLWYLALIVFELLGGPRPAGANYGVMAAIHILTLPWAFVIGAALGVWVFAQGTVRARWVAGSILGLSLISNVIVLVDYNRAF